MYYINIDKLAMTNTCASVEFPHYGIWYDLLFVFQMWYKLDYMHGFHPFIRFYLHCKCSIFSLIAMQWSAAFRGVDTRDIYDGCLALCICPTGFVILSWSGLSNDYNHWMISTSFSILLQVCDRKLHKIYIVTLKYFITLSVKHNKLQL